MATIVTLIDRAQVNYEQSFIYSINASFNGIEGNIASAQIKDMIPDTITFTLPQIIAPLKNIITQPVLGGTEITFDFGPIIDLGIAVTLELECQYKLTTPNGTSFANQTTLWINGNNYMQYTADNINLVLNPRFTLEIYTILPTVSPAPGGSVILGLDMHNYQDKGAVAEDIEVTMTLPEGVTFDTSFVVVGKDISKEPFVDRSADGIEGNIINNVLTFILPSYRGVEYRVPYKIILSDILQIGTQIPLQATWTINSISQTPGNISLTLAALNRHGAVSKYGPDYTLQGQPINYELYFVNDGNCDLINVNIVDELPLQNDYTSFETGTFYIEAIKKRGLGNYMITYSTHAGITGTLGPFSTDVNSIILFNTLGLASGDYIISLSWNLYVFGLGVTQDIPPKINGVVKNNLIRGTRILNHFHMEWDIPGGRDQSINNRTTVVDDLCILRPQLSQVSPNANVNPGNTIRYQAFVNCWNSRLNRPIIAFLLPPTLQYVGNVTVNYGNYFTGALTPVTPPPVVVPNFKGSGMTLVKWVYEGDFAYSFWQRATITIRFDTKVVIGAKGSIRVNMLLNNENDTGVIPNDIEIFTDPYDIEGSSSQNKLYAQSQTITNQINFFTSIASNKKVKGALDAIYVEEPIEGRTQPGGMLNYQLAIMNTGNVDLESVEIVDILPHVGDTGVVEVNVYRESAFKVYNVANVVATLTPVDIGDPQPQIQVYYSRSYDPVRFGNAYQTIGTVNDWSLQPPSVSTTLASFKIATQNTKVKPGQTLRIQLVGVVPVDSPVGAVAWNSFAAKVSYKNRNSALKYFLPVEPEKVGIAVVNPTNPGKIGGMIWQDIHKNGVYEQGDPGINDITIVLYNTQGIAVGSTVTTSNQSGQEGHYVFGNLPFGKYYIRVVVDEREYSITLRQLGQENGSVFDPVTGLSPQIDLKSQQEEMLDVSGGLIVLTTNDRMKDVLAMNKSAQKMVRNVIYNEILLINKLEDVTDLSRHQ
ncbi:MAG: SdrD B-like domain-containing protein [Cellulosilyticaceae bacterium]